MNYANLFVQASDIYIQNYYGALSLKKGSATTGGFKSGASEVNQGDAMTTGPWTLAGDPNGSDDTWEQSYAQEMMPNTSISCGSGRMIGNIPDSVFTG